MTPRRLPVLNASASATHVNSRCALVSRLGRPAYKSCNRCTLELSNCIQFRGQLATVALLAILLVATLAPLPQSLRFGLGVIACAIVLVYMRYVAEESAGSISAAYDLREQKAHVEELVAQRTAELARANTELMTSINEVRAAQTKLARTSKLAAVGTLAAGVAHEINNPLTYVLANVDLAIEELRDALPSLPSLPILPDTIENLMFAREGSLRIKKIVGDLSVFARPEAEQSVVALDLVVRNTVAIARSGIRHRATVTEDYRDTPAVVGSESRIGQVVLNLLTNAAQAIREDSAHKEIRISTYRDASGRAVVEVRDTGCGMPVEVIGKAFDPFFTTKAIGGGTGLGLSISHDIVTAMGGEIAMESELGNGSVFRVSLPAAPLQPATEPSQPVPSQLVTAPAPPAPSPPPRDVSARIADGAARTHGRRVMVIDDEPQILRHVSRLLGTEHELVTFDDARVALARIDDGARYDLILCDVMMPHMTGVDFHEQLARRVPAQAERVLFVTGGACTPSTQEFLERIPDRCLLKPFSAVELRAAVARHGGEVRGGGATEPSAVALGTS